MVATAVEETPAAPEVVADESAEAAEPDAEASEEVVVAETADRVIVQYKGRKMEEADVLSLFEAPKNPYTKALLSALPENATGDRLTTVSDFMAGAAAGENA